MTEKLAELFEEEGARKKPATGGADTGPRAATRPGLAKTSLQAVRGAAAT